jgi:hypothetical protein
MAAEDIPDVRVEPPASSLTQQDLSISN